VNASAKARGQAPSGAAGLAAALDGATCNACGCGTCCGGGGAKRLESDAGDCVGAGGCERPGRVGRSGATDDGVADFGLSRVFTRPMSSCG